MVKRSVLIFVIALITTLFVSCNKTESSSQNDNIESNDPIFSLWIYPSSNLNETYQISLLENNVLQVNVGERSESILLNPSGLTKTEIESKKYLGDIDYGIIDAINDIYNNPYIKTNSKIYSDAWMIKFSYKDRNIIQPCDDISPELEGLYQFLIELSPIEIDMRGFA